MLQYAHFHREEVMQLFKKEVVPQRMLSRYKYLFTIPFHDFNQLRIETDTMRSIQMVSMDGDRIVGFLSAEVDRSVSAVKELTVVNYTDNSYVFSRDLRKFFGKLLLGYNMNKITFSVVVGNPAEKIWDKIMETYGGRIVGIYKSHVRLADNRVYDLKVYECTRDELLKRIKRKDMDEQTKEN